MTFNWACISHDDIKKQKKKKRGQKIKDRTGQKNGRLTFLEYTGSSNKVGQALWKCRCDCNPDKIVIKYWDKQRKYCGEYPCGRHRYNESSIISCTPKDSKLTFIEFITTDMYEQHEKHVRVWCAKYWATGTIPRGLQRQGHAKFLCDCGQTTIRHISTVIQGKTKSCGHLLYSKPEAEIANILNQYGISFEYNRGKTPLMCFYGMTCLKGLIPKQRIDFTLTDHDRFIECQGEQHFIGSCWFSKEEFKRQQELDQLKRDVLGNRLIEIRYDEDITKRLKEEGII